MFLHVLGLLDLIFQFDGLTYFRNTSDCAMLVKTWLSDLINQFVGFGLLDVNFVYRIH